MELKKVCKHGLNDIWINNANGNVRMCGWSNYFIGNLADQSIDEIWNGEKAEVFRESMLDGSYRFCNHGKCPYCANNELEKQLVDYEVPKYPTMCSLSYQLQCNYVCRFCRSQLYSPCESEKENYQKIEKELKKIAPGLKMISANGAGELFCSDSILDYLKNADISPDTEVQLETNGSLFNEKNWSRIQNLGNKKLSVIVTVHSFNEETYQYLSGTKLPIKNIKDNLKFVSELRDKDIINKFEIATVVCERNFREMPEFVKHCLSEYAVDSIRLRFFEPYGVMDKMTEWFYDVRNPKHPYYEEFCSIMSDPIFDNEKVWKWQGEELSLQSENPYVTEHENFLAISELVTLLNLNVRIRRFIEKKKKNSIALYGAGVGGKAYIKLLNENGMKIDTIYDTYAKETYFSEMNYGIIKPTRDNIKKNDLIIITSNTYFAQIKEELTRLNYQGEIMSINCLVDELKKKE